MCPVAHWWKNSRKNRAAQRGNLGQISVDIQGSFGRTSTVRSFVGGLDSALETFKNKQFGLDIHDTQRADKWQLPCHFLKEL